MTRSWSVPIVIAVLTAAVYSSVPGFDFLSYDDGLYVTGNRHVLNGLNREGLAWAFSSLSDAANWHPLTWLSHMVDVECFGLWPGGHHVVNVIIHATNASILFLVLRASTGHLWRSALVAILFAVHPLHVESVAWVSERKDVLSALGWFLAMGAYLHYVRKPGMGRYLAVLLVFALGLMAKSMLVTLPLVLLLLDWWPLGRPRGTKGERVRLLLEKLPLVLLSVAAGTVAIVAQQKARALGSIEIVRLPARLANALVSLMVYLGETLWPRRLAFFYPLPAEGTPAWEAVTAGVILAGAFLLILARRRAFPWLTAGWLWYIITILPVIGLLQVGAQARADRYTYIPLTGIFLIASWGLSEVGGGRHRISSVASAAIVGLLAAQAGSQVGTWRDDRTLFTHALTVTGEGNYVAQNNLGVSLVMEGKYDDAIRHYRQAVRSRERYLDARLNLGVALTLTGNVDEALVHLEEAARIQPLDDEVHFQLGEALLRKGRPEPAGRRYLEAIRLDPGRADAYLGLGIAKATAGQVREAVGLLEKSLELAPDTEAGHYNLAVALASLGRDAEAAHHYRKALALNPGNERAAGNLRVLQARGQAAKEFQPRP